MESRPGVFVVGSSGVGKRTLLSRLLSVDFEDSSESPSETEVHSWTINTKYYSADVSVWISNISDDFPPPTLPQSPPPLVALVMVFDLNKMLTLVALQEWVSHTDINSFDILLCIGNKADLVPNHLAHLEYRKRRRLLMETDSSIDEFGISECEGSKLLDSEDDATASLDIKGRCLEWCSELNIEFIEACGSNPDFDKCLSVDGDSQGVERVFGALSAHMWPGMILKSGDQINEPVLPLHEEVLSSSEESEYELEYEVLSGDQWENNWVSASETTDASGASTSQLNHEREEEASSVSKRVEPLPEKERRLEETGGGGKEKCYEFEDVEQLMSEIGNIRDNLRLMPDFQRREIAANLAMKMASMFGGDTDDDEEGQEV